MSDDFDLEVFGVCYLEEWFWLAEVSTMPMDKTHLVRLDPKWYRQWFTHRLTLLRLLKQNFTEDDWVSLLEIVHLSAYSRIHYDGTNLTKEWHSLVLLDVTCWDGVHQDFFANVLNAWLIAGATNIWYLDKSSICIICNIVPRTVEWHRQSCILTYLIGSACH